MTAPKKKKKRKKETKKGIQVHKKDSCELSYLKFLSPFMEIIQDEYKPCNREAYRWSHIPMIDDDSKPQIFQDCDSRNIEQMMVPNSDAPRIIINQYVNSFTISNFDTYEHAETKYLEIIQRMKRKNHYEEKIENFIKQKGTHIIKVNYTPDTAIVNEPDKTGHFQALLFENINLNDLVDESVQPRRIDLK